MKSHVQGVGPDAHVPPAAWRRLVLDHGELLRALEENAVGHLVRETLRPHYGDLLSFHVLVADATRVALLSLAGKVRLATLTHGFGPHLAVMLPVEGINEAELAARARAAAAPVDHAWKREGE